jgi:hypothetical protein
MCVMVRVLLPFVAALALFALLPAFALSSSRPPTSAQIRAAARHAERSPYLWTTINICNTRRYPLTLGIRGQMPSLGFPASLYMNVQALYLSNRRFVAVPKVRKLIGLGRQATGLHQGGVSFRFSPGAGRLSGTIRFIWKRGGKVVAQATRRATRGHPSADYGNPTHYSAAQCKIS